MEWWGKTVLVSGGVRAFLCGAGCFCLPLCGFPLGAPAIVAHVNAAYENPGQSHESLISWLNKGF